MKTMDCRSVTSEVNARELNQQLSPEAGRHLSSCASCRKISEQGASLRALVASLGGAGAPADFDMRLRARLAREKEPASIWVSFWRQAPGVPAIGLAFSLLVLVGLAIYFLPGNSPQLATRPQPVAPNLATRTAAEPSPVPVAPVGGTEFVQTASAPRPLKSNAGLNASRRAGMGSREFSSLPAVTVRNSGDNAGASSQVVSLSAPVQPVVVSMRDDHGATRTISVPPVSFGSQKLIQPSYQPVSLASSKGAW